jgi:uncharacterized protein YeaO (DUF488 family)
VPVRLRRAYEPPSPTDGSRYLVDRLWPRGVSADRLRLTEWRKDLAPSERLRRWYGHDPARFNRFRTEYRSELDQQRDAIGRLRTEARRGTVTLVFAARDADHSNAAVLAEVISRPPAKQRR